MLEGRMVQNRHFSVPYWKTGTPDYESGALTFTIQRLVFQISRKRVGTNVLLQMYLNNIYLPS